MAARWVVMLVAQLILLSPAASRADLNPNVGTTGYSFLKIGIAPRPSALGGAFTAVRGDLSGLAHNPAAIATIGKGGGVASYMRYLVDTQAGFVAAGRPLRKFAVGTSVSYVSYGEIPRTDESGTADGTFGPQDLAVGLSVGRSAWSSRLSAGATFKWIFSSIDTYSADAYAIDIGVIARPLSERTSLGASVCNMGATRKGYTATDSPDLPAVARMGISHRLAHLPITLVGDALLPNDNDPSFSVGAEISLGEVLTVRPGYNSSASALGKLERSAGLSFGAGIAVRDYQIDYAFTSFSDLGDIHRIGVAGKW